MQGRDHLKKILLSTFDCTFIIAVHIIFYSFHNYDVKHVFGCDLQGTYNRIWV